MVSTLTDTRTYSFRARGGGSRGAGLGVVVQHEADDGDRVAVHVLRDYPGVLLKTDLPQTVEQVAVDGLRGLVGVLRLRRLEVGDALLEGGVGEPGQDQAQAVGVRHLPGHILAGKVGFERSKRLGRRRDVRVRRLGRAGVGVGVDGVEDGL